MIMNSVHKCIENPSRRKERKCTTCCCQIVSSSVLLNWNEKSNQNSTLSVGNLQRAWVTYRCRNEQIKAPPLRVIFGHELKRSLSARFASNKTLMEAIVMKAVEQGLWVKSIDPAVVKNILDTEDLSEILPTTTPIGRSRRLDIILLGINISRATFNTCDWWKMAVMMKMTPQSLILDAIQFHAVCTGDLFFTVTRDINLSRKRLL